MIFTLTLMLFAIIVIPMIISKDYAISKKQLHILYVIIPLQLIIFFAGDTDNLITYKGCSIALFIVFLNYISLTDILYRVIPNKLLLINFVSSLIIILMNSMSKNFSIVLVIKPLLSFLLLGFIYSIVYMLSKKSIGAGDIKLMSLLAIIFSFDTSISIVLYSSVFCLIYSLTLLVLKKARLNSSIPFAPFILISTLLIGR